MLKNVCFLLVCVSRYLRSRCRLSDRMGRPRRSGQAGILLRQWPMSSGNLCCRRRDRRSSCLCCRFRPRAALRWSSPSTFCGFGWNGPAHNKHRQALSFLSRFSSWLCNSHSKSCSLCRLGTECCSKRCRCWSQLWRCQQLTSKFLLKREKKKNQSDN